MDYYKENKSILHLHLTDSNPQMLQEAFNKIKASDDIIKDLPPVSCSILDIVALGDEFHRQTQQQGSEQQHSQKWAAGSFDTVIDTFGLCSMSNPVIGLRALGRLVKPNGRIILLEHGRSPVVGPKNITGDATGKHLHVEETSSSNYGLGWRVLSWFPSMLKGLNTILDKTASAHAREWGCWWNRDIEGLVRDAGLTIVRVQRFHFGTTVMIECERNK